MHRVELKVSGTIDISETDTVPNAPCGVESYVEEIVEAKETPEFLMHRVELKETKRSEQSKR